MKKMFILVIVIITMFVFSNTVFAYKQYKIGDTVKYNDIDFYVIKDSSREEDIVTLLKAEPLTVDEVNRYGKGHVNRYTSSSVGTAYDSNGYGGMAYYTSETCGYVNNNGVSTGCTTSYASSEVKYVVDAWKTAKAPAATEARLISKDEIETERKEYDPCGGCGAVATGDISKYNWMYNNNYWYWTNTPYTDSSSRVWYVGSAGELESDSVHNGFGSRGFGVVRPVVVLYKSAIDNGFISDDNIDDKSNKIESNEIIDNGINLNEEKQEIKETIKVPNTLKSISGLIVLVGMVLVCIGINIFIIVKNRNGRKKERI